MRRKTQGVEAGECQRANRSSCKHHPATRPAGPGCRTPSRSLNLTVSGDNLMKHMVFLAAVFLALSTTSAEATRYYVDKDNTEGPYWDGSTWDWAFQDLEVVLDNWAFAGDEVWVANAFEPYQGATFTLKSGVDLYGGFIGIGEGGYETELGQRDWAANPTILDGQGERLVVFTESNTVVDGFVIRNGKSDASGNGGGVYVSGGSVSVRNCRIENNYANDGAGYGRGAGVYLASAGSSFVNCVLSNNNANANGLGGAVYGGQGHHSDFRNCVFDNNYAKYGGAIFHYRSSGALRNCTLYNNEARIEGNLAGSETYNHVTTDSCISFFNCIIYEEAGGTTVATWAAV